MNCTLDRLGIPSTFMVLNHHIVVKEIPNLPEMSKYGDWDADLNEIRLFTQDVCDDVILHSYYHELAHCLFDRAGRTDLSEDEVLVDLIGGLLAQYYTTSSLYDRGSSLD